MVILETCHPLEESINPVLVLLLYTDIQIILRISVVSMVAIDKFEIEAVPLMRLVYINMARNNHAYYTCN